MEENLYEISQIEGLTCVDTTSEMSGYPRNISSALIGFNSFEHAEEVAERWGLELTQIEKRDGWQLWYRTGHRPYEAIEVDAEDFGANCIPFYPGQFSSESEFIKEEIINRIDIITTLDELQSLVNKGKELWEQMEKTDENSILVVDNLNVIEILPRRVMHYHYDNKHIAVALIKPLI